MNIIAVSSIEERTFCKKNYATELIEHNKLHGFVVRYDNEIIGFCNADLKDNYFRLSKESNLESWIGLDKNDKVLAIVCFTIEPNYRGKGCKKKCWSMRVNMQEKMIMIISNLILVKEHLIRVIVVETGQCMNHKGLHGIKFS